MTLASASPESSPRRRGVRPILILAEGDRDIRIALAKIFVADGFDVIAVRSGRELVVALEMARDSEEFPAIVVTDQRTLGPSGLEVTRALRVNGWPIAVILIMGVGADSERLALEAGADVVFTGPLDTDDLRTAVWYWAQARGVIDWCR